MAVSIEQKIRHIAQIGRQNYREVNLRGAIDNKARLLSDWYYALKFFLGYVFYGGRRNELSLVFEVRALRCLNDLLCGSPDAPSPATTLAALNRLESEGWLENPLRSDANNLVNQKLCSAGVNKRTDRLMVIDSLVLAVSLPQCNIVAWAVQEIENGRLGAVDAKLQSVCGVGPMKSSFFLRDTVSVFELENKVAEKDGVRLQPVDTWVRRVSAVLGLVSEQAADQEVRAAIIARCHQAGVSFIDFNQGAFYVGNHSLLESDLFLATL